MASDHSLAETLGVPPSEHPDGCDGRGWVDPEPGWGLSRCSGCERDALLAAVVQFTPSRFRKRVELPEQVEAWVSGGHGSDGLYLTGKIGTGKTQLAYCTAATWCISTSTTPKGEYHLSDWLGGSRVGANVAFRRTTDLLDALRPGSDDVRQVVADCQGADLLILDDLGAEKPSEWTCEKLYSIIDERYARGRPLIVTSNVPPRKIGEHVGERTASRLAEMCQVHVVSGKDRRRQL